MLTREQQADFAGMLDAFVELEQTIATAFDAEPWKRVPESERKAFEASVHEFIASGRRMLAAMTAVQAFEASVHESIASGRRMLAAMTAVQASVDAMTPP